MRGNDTSGRRGGGRGRIALLEDHDATRALVARSLELAGHDVLAFATADEALAGLRCAPIDLLVTDVELPDGDGLDVAVALRSARAELPVLVMSGAADPTTTETRAVRCGAAVFMAKPFGLDALVDACERLLGRAVADFSRRRLPAPRAPRTPGDGRPAPRASTP